MKFIKKLTPIILTLMIVLVLSACSSALEKPTGLENNQDQSTSQVEKKDSEKQENKKAEKKEQQKEKKSESKKTSKDDKKVKEKQSEDDSKIEDNAKKKENKKNASSKSSKQSSQTNNQSEVKEKTKSGSKPSAQKQKKSEKKSSQSKTESKPKPKPAPKPKPKPKPEPKKATVTQSIVISSSEVPLSNAKTEIKDGDTILDALIKVTRDKGIQMDYRGGQGSGAYVEGIANVYEFDRGQGSGWMIRINGVFPNRGVGTIPVYDGDNIEWLYTTDLGEDLGANLQPFR